MKSPNLMVMLDHTFMLKTHKIISAMDCGIQSCLEVCFISFMTFAVFPYSPFNDWEDTSSLCEHAICYCNGRPIDPGLKSHSLWLVVRPL